MVNYLGDAYYLTRWCVGKVRRCFFRRKFVVGFAFHEFSLSPFAQALPLLFDTDGSFEDIDTEASELRRDVHGGNPEPLHLLVGFDEGGCVRCALGPSYLFEDSFPGGEAYEIAFAKAVQARPYQFGVGVMQFLLTLARGTYALPLSAVCKARRYARDDDLDDSEASLAAANGSDSGAANDGSGPSKGERAMTPFVECLKFAKYICNM